MVVTKDVQHVLDKAKSMPKGRYYIYDSLKRELYNMNLSPEEYQSACIELAKILRV